MLFPDRPRVSLDAIWLRFFIVQVIRVIRARIGTLCECTELIRNVRMKWLTSDLCIQRSKRESWTRYLHHLPGWHRRADRDVLIFIFLYLFFRAR